MSVLPAKAEFPRTALPSMENLPCHPEARRPSSGPQGPTSSLCFYSIIYERPEKKGKPGVKPASGSDTAEISLFLPIGDQRVDVLLELRMGPHQLLEIFARELEKIAVAFGFDGRLADAVKDE